MQIEVYQSRETGPQQSTTIGGLPGERQSGMLNVPTLDRTNQAVGDIGKALQDIGNRMQQAAEVQEFSSAMVQGQEGLAGIYEQIRQDESLTGATVDELEQAFAERSAELRGTINVNMKEHKAKKAFDNKFAEDEMRARLKVRDFGRQRFIDQARASTDQELQKLSGVMIATGDINQIANGQAIIDGKVKAGIFSAQEGVDLSNRFRKNAVVGYYERMIDNPKTSAIAYQQLRENPDSLSFVDERTKSALIDKARTAAQRDTEDAYTAAVLNEVKAKFGGDVLKAIEHLENPDNFKALKFENRARIISYLAATENRKRLQEEAQRKAQAEYDRAGIFGAMLTNDIDKAVELTAASRAIDIKEKVDLFEKINTYPWKTNPAVEAKIALGIQRGEITEPEQIIPHIGHGLSVDDADKRIKQLQQPKYKEALDYAEKNFKLLYPAKDDLEKNMRWMEFVQMVDGDINRQNADRVKAGKVPLTDIEAREVVDGYLQPVTQEDAGFLWFDKQFRPVENWMEGKEPFPKEAAGGRAPISSFHRQFMGDIPRDSQEQIADYLYQSGKKINPANISAVWNQVKKQKTYKIDKPDYSERNYQP